MSRALIISSQAIILRTLVSVLNLQSFWIHSLTKHIEAV